jgi:HlyD family secretion protein
LPLSAVLTGNDGSSARKVEDNVVKFVKVETGIQDGAYVEITKGLKSGEEVVAKAGAYVRDGDRITPVREQPPASN